MAKKSSIARNNKRIRLVKKYQESRTNLKNITNDPKKSFEEKMEARQQLALLPKNSSPIRVRNRCQKTGRPRGYMRTFGISRVTFREMANNGLIPGVKKASW